MPVILDGYTFHIDDGMTETQVYPVISELVFVDEPDADFGYYRKILQTEMVFAGADYSLIYAIELSGCETLDFIVRLNGTDVYTGLLKTQTPNINVNLRDCIITARIEPQDDYTCLVQSWEDEFNILSGTNKVTVNRLLGTIVSDTCDRLGDSVIDLLGAGDNNACLSAPTSAWALLERTITQIGPSPPNNFQDIAEWVQEQVTWPCSVGVPVQPPGGGWQLLADNCGTTTDALWGRAPAVENIAYENSSAGYSELNQLAGADFDDIPNAVPLAEILDTYTPCSLSVVSDFFGIDPDLTHPANDAYDAALENLQDVVVFQKSDVRLPNALQPASVGRMTFRQLLNMLLRQFNVEPRIIGSTLRLEHWTYWAAASGLDLSVSPYRELVEPSLQYGYNNARLAKTERWSFMENASFRFNGRPIEYTACVPQDAPAEIAYPIERTNNDVAYIVANPDQAADDGFVFANTVQSGGQYYFLYELVVGGLTLNGHMSITNLLDNYHRDNRLLLEGRLNGAGVTFNSAIKRKTQTEFTVIISRATYHTAFDAGDEITTVLGDGKAARITYNAADCTMTIQLEY